MARYGPPDDPGRPDDEPTQFINYGNYGPGQTPATPWYRKPVALVSFGAAGAVVIALIVFGLVKWLTAGMPSDNQPTLTPITKTATSMTAPMTTVTTTATTTEPTTTTTEPTTTSTTTTATTATSSTSTTVTSVSTSVSTSTITQTVTVPAPGG